MDIGVNSDVGFSADLNPNTMDILKVLGSGIGLDVAKNHTGVAIYNGGVLTRYGFELCEYDSSDPHAEFNMRLDLKKHFQELLQGLDVNYIVIEDVFAGKNFDTVRKLIALNTVIDELLYEGVVKTKVFFRWKEATWMKYFRMILKITGKPNVKYETQQILEYLRDDFYMANKDLSNAEKTHIYFEDICDASAMLMAVAMYVETDGNKKEQKKLTLKDIKMMYFNYFEECFDYGDSRIGIEMNHPVSPVFRNLEKKILSEAEAHPDKVLSMELPVSKLGSFGLKHKFTYYEDGNGYLFWYRKK